MYIGISIAWSWFPRKRRAVRGNFVRNRAMVSFVRGQFEVVLRGLDPRIRAFASGAGRRGWPGQARPRRICMVGREVDTRSACRPDFPRTAMREGGNPGTQGSGTRPWTPAFPTVQARGLKAHGATNNLLIRNQTIPSQTLCVRLKMILPKSIIYRHSRESGNPGPRELRAAGARAIALCSGREHTRYFGFRAWFILSPARRPGGGVLQVCLKQRLAFSQNSLRRMSGPRLGHSRILSTECGNHDS